MRGANTEGADRRGAIGGNVEEGRNPGGVDWSNSFRNNKNRRIIQDARGGDSGSPGPLDIPG